MFTNDCYSLRWCQNAHFWVRHLFKSSLQWVLVRLLPSQKARWRVRYPPSHRSEVPRETFRTFAFTRTRSQQQTSISSPWHQKFSFHASLFLEPSFSSTNITLRYFQAQPKCRESVKLKENKPFSFHEVPLPRNTSLKNPDRESPLCLLLYCALRMATRRGGKINWSI